MPSLYYIFQCWTKPGLLEAKKVFRLLRELSTVRLTVSVYKKKHVIKGQNPNIFRKKKTEIQRCYLHIALRLKSSSAYILKPAQSLYMHEKQNTKIAEKAKTLKI